MEISDNSDLSDTVKQLSIGSRKKNCTGRTTDVMEKLRLSTYEIGPDCKCLRYKCFGIISLLQKILIIKILNEILTRDEQNL
jgi:hypothetical protein